MIATSGSETSTYETELDVRNPNPPVTTEENRLLEPGQKWSPAVTVPGMAGTNHAFLELAAIPGLNLSRHLDDLIQYPHGCAEQTVSAGFCQLYLENLVQLTPAEKMRAEENIKGTIQRLQGLQTSTGGFAYWPGQNASDDWCSGYAGHFLILAAQKGYSVPGEMKNRWLSFQITRARQWRPATAGDPFTQRQEALIQAYRLYTLALAGSPERGVMNRFREDVSGFAQARWRLAAAFLLAGQTGAADMLIQQSQITTEEYPGHDP
jgi:uncharacterized protein YfaS (alpha-2-macroglobulin family)